MLSSSVTRRFTSASISAPDRVGSILELVSFGSISPPGGWSHSWVTPTSDSAAPAKWTISVALGRRETTCKLRSSEPLLAKLAPVAQEGRLADVVGGQHADEVAILHDGEGAEAALLEGAVAVGKEVGVGGEGGEVRPHQVADAGVLVRGVGGGHDLTSREDADEPALLVHHREVLLVAVQDGVEDLPEVVVGRYGLRPGLGPHNVGDREAAHHLPLAYEPGLAARPEKYEDGDQGQREAVGNEGKDKEPDGEDLADGRGYVRGPHGPQAGGEQAAQDAPAARREGGRVGERGRR